MLRSRPSRALQSCLVALLTQVSGQVQQQDAAAKIYAESAKSVSVILVKSPNRQLVSQGTGFLIADGKIVTNRHVIDGGTPVADLGGVRIPLKPDRIDELNDI